jgi:hypothetical protein
MTTTQSNKRTARLVAYLGAAALSVALLASLHNVAMPACAEEDSAGPCYWNASTMGNGVGQSFTVDAQQVVHYGATR